MAAIHHSIVPVWASEIESFPIEVTKIRFPDMVHVGDITKLDGAKIPPVDVICGGSPCQDLSVAGQRAGLAGERSGLFMDQVRVVKEMRKADEQRNISNNLIRPLRPRYFVWENVPGAFSSAEGEDFRAVIEEIVRIKDSTCHVPRPQSGRWESAGAAILGDEFSLAWRVLDAQFWGVAQRRRRIFLVADFAGFTAPEILFKQDSLFGDIAESKSQGQGTAASAQGRAHDTGGACLTSWDAQAEKKIAVTFVANQRDEVRDLHDIAGAIQAQPGKKQQTFVAEAEKINAFLGNQRDETIDRDGASGVLLSTLGMQMQTFISEPLICLNDHGGERMDVTEEITPTLRAGMGGHPPLVAQTCCLSEDIQKCLVFTSDREKRTPDRSAESGDRNPIGYGFVAGVVSKSDGDCFLTPEKHTSITSGGGHAGQGYPCALTAGFCDDASTKARGIGYQSECSPTIKTGAAPSVICLNDQGGSQMHCTEEVTGTLRSQEHGHQPLVMATRQEVTKTWEGISPPLTSAAGITGISQSVLFDNHAKDCRYTGPLKVAPTVTSIYGTGGNNVPLVGNPAFFSFDSKEENRIKSADSHSGCKEINIARTIVTNDGHTVFSRQRSDEFSKNDVAATQSARQHKDATDLVCQPYQETVGTIGYSDHKGINNQFVSEDKCIVERRNLIRRLTPLECERLQGFPDDWTLIPGASDSARYKALGNSVAIPCVDFVLRGIAYFLRKNYEEQEESPSCTSTLTT